MTSSQDVREVHFAYRCYQCGSDLNEAASFCPMCGMAVLAAPARTLGSGLRSEARTVAVPTPVPAQWPRETASTPMPTPGTSAFDAPHVNAARGAQRGFRPSRNLLIIGALVVALGVGGGIAYEVLKPSPATPASIVQQYFDDLSRGDTAAALTLVADADQLSDQPSTALLVPKALSSPAARPTDVHVGNTTTLSGIARAAGYAVRVTYKVGDSDLATDFPVMKAPSGAKSPYLLDTPFFDLELGDAGGRPVSVNGVTIDTGQASTYYAFPGVYTATAQGNGLLASDTQVGVVEPSTTDTAPTDTVTFAAPQLAPGAQDAVLAQVKQQLDTCAQSTDPYPDGCPFDLYDVYIDGSISSVQWSITAYPNITVTADSTPTPDEQATFSDPDSDGTAHYVATYTDYSGATQTASGDVSFGVQGSAKASASGSGVTVTFD